MHLPQLPEDEDETTERSRIPTSAKLLIAALFVVIALVVALHLTGVIGGSQLHG
jgi:hypothetical protein